MQHRSLESAVAAVALAAALAGPAAAADQVILGKQLKLKHPPSNVETVIGFGKEVASAATVVGDPLANGAVVMLFANGDTNQSTGFALPPGAFVPGGAGWVATPTGYIYKASGIPDGVKKCLIKKTAKGVFLLRCLLKGNVPGLEPPGNITDGGMHFEIIGGDTYCVALGGAAGGRINRPGDTITNATTEVGCVHPTPSSTTTTTTSSTTTTYPPGPCPTNGSATACNAYRLSTPIACPTCCDATVNCATNCLLAIGLSACIEPAHAAACAAAINAAGCGPVCCP